jgi:PAS domain S-box-containing protein
MNLLRRVGDLLRRYGIGVAHAAVALGAGRRRSLERALRESEERFRALVKFSFDVYWETDAQHRFTRQEFSERLADAPRSEVGKTRWEIPYVEPDEDGMRRHRAMLDAHVPFRDFELARPTPEGGRRYVSVSGIPVFDDAGRFTGYRGVGRHITERKRAEAEHRAHLWFLESMDRINRAMQPTSDLEKMMSDVLEAVLEVFSCDRAWLVYPCDPQTAAWRVVMDRSRPPYGGGSARRADIPTDASVAAGFAAARASRGVVLDVPAGLAKRFAVRSRMAMALYPQGDAPYLFGMHQCSRERAWTADEQRLFEEIGRRLADALSNLIAVRSLRESERRLEAAQRLAHVGWWARDYVTGRVALSDEASRIFGVQPVDLPQWQDKWMSLIHPEDRERVAAASEAALAGGARYDVEYRVVRPDGAVRMVHSQGDVTRDESGHPMRQFGVMQDITELRQAEQGLRARQDMLDLAQRAAGAVAYDWYVGARESENRWSPEIEALFGLEPGTFDGTYEGWKKLVYPDDWPAVKLAIERAHQTGDITTEYRVIHKDGTVHWLRGKGRMFFDADGRPARNVGFIYDLTDRRQAEEALRASEARFRTFVDHATDGFFLMDEKLTVVDANRQACESMGWSRDELIGMHPHDFNVGLDELTVARLVQRAAGGETPTFETLHRRKDGTMFPVEIRIRMFEERGERRYIALARDISERKLAEETLRGKEHALQIARAELARVSRVTTLGELTASIAHEVNQPLGAMVANAAACTRWLAADPPESARAQRALESIAADGRRASEIIGRIRGLVKRQVPRKSQVDVNLKIAQVIELAMDEIRRNGIVLRTELAEGLPRVEGDRVQLQQVLLNLMLNAIEAMSPIRDRARELTIVTCRDGPDAVRIEVHDTGPGLDPERAAQVFEPFYTTKPDGLGIGLSISRSIVEAHGGRLWASPNEPRGAIFRFSLPVGEAAE